MSFFTLECSEFRPCLFVSQNYGHAPLLIVMKFEMNVLDSNVERRINVRIFVSLPFQNGSRLVDQFAVTVKCPTDSHAIFMLKIVLLAERCEIFVLT